MRAGAAGRAGEVLSTSLSSSSEIRAGSLARASVDASGNGVIGGGTMS